MTSSEELDILCELDKTDPLIFELLMIIDEKAKALDIKLTTVEGVRILKHLVKVKMEQKTR